MDGFDLMLKIDEQEADGAEIYVEATVQGRPYEFLLDTGSAITSIRWDEFTCHLPPEGTHSSSGLMGTVLDELITIRDFKLGSIERETVTVARMSKEHRHARNLLGMDLLKDFCCAFSFGENRVSLAPQPLALQNDLFLDDSFHPYVLVDVVGATAHAVWDTGASLTCVDLDFIAHHPQSFEEAGQSIGTDASGHSATTPLFLMKAFSCGGQPFPAHRVVGIDLSIVNAKIDHPMTMILGYSTLYKANWIFDFPKRKWDILEIL